MNRILLLHSAMFSILAWSFAAAAEVRYVDVNNATPTPPYTNWVTAATVIQDAIGLALPGDEIVVTNGVYQTGRGVAFPHGLGYAATTNRVAVTKPLLLRSINGPEVTVIRGYGVPGATNGPGTGAIRCVYLASGATLAGFTLTNGFGLDYGGGGVLCSSGAVVSNCVLSGNSGGGAVGGTLSNCILIGNTAADEGGGAAGSTLNNCRITGNSAQDDGGGAWECVLNHCLITGNSARIGGGAWGGLLNNCTVTANTAQYGGGVSPSFHLICCGTPQDPTILNNSLVYDNSASQDGHNYWNYPSSVGTVLTFNYSCTVPLPATGLGNITNPPLFVDAASGDLHLQRNSPCINAGSNAYVPVGIDLDGNPRIMGGSVDIGAYEFQSPQSTISYAWLQQYGLATDGSADLTDPDGDGLNNWQEWRAGTDPTNSLSVLRLLSPETSASGIVVRWQSVSDRSYFLEVPRPALDGRERCDSTRRNVAGAGVSASSARAPAGDQRCRRISAARTLDCRDRDQSLDLAGSRQPRRAGALAPRPPNPNQHPVVWQCQWRHMEKHQQRRVLVSAG